MQQHNLVPSGDIGHKGSKKYFERKNILEKKKHFEK